MSLEVGFGPKFDALGMLADRRAVDDTVRIPVQSVNRAFASAGE